MERIFSGLCLRATEEATAPGLRSGAQVHRLVATVGELFVDVDGAHALLAPACGALALVLVEVILNKATDFGGEYAARAACAIISHVAGSGIEVSVDGLIRFNEKREKIWIFGEMGRMKAKTVVMIETSDAGRLPHSICPK
ncbi:MAG: hypothetical protein LBU98_03360 [Alistipes sp.]|jgi:hypothetical protein|nr:hypothetical protein [Alistipes sp.]